MRHAVEVVDDCGEDYGPSSDDRVEAVVGSDGGLTRSIEWIVAYENLKETRVSVVLPRVDGVQMVHPFGSVGSYGGYGGLNICGVEKARTRSGSRRSERL